MCQFSGKTDIFKILCAPVSIFSQNGQIGIFRPKSGEIVQLHTIFGSNNVEGIAESLVEVEMS